MLFNAPVYFLLFLPISICLFYLSGRFSHALALTSLVICSLVFYGYWHPPYLLILLGSITVNYLLSNLISVRQKNKQAKTLLWLGILFNVLLLGHYKYTNFIIDNFNALTDSQYFVNNILLPIGISFFTFQQIAYLVDSYRGEVADNRFLNYVLFICFFPQLIAGPIVHHSDVVSQYSDKRIFHIKYQHIYCAVILFAIGLFKKVIIADYFAGIVDTGYSSSEVLSSLNAWITVLSYTFQIYFDFSGYTDMALASALFFNIRLPTNFNSPYQARNIQDFWRRWHITLSKWLGQYLYIPLGGNRKGFSRMLINVMIVFIIGGIWHGANWTFVLWGFSHGLAIATYHLGTRFKLSLSKPLAWSITFLFVVLSWVLFRAENIPQALAIYHALLFGDWQGVAFEQLVAIVFLLIAFFVIWQKNSNALVNELLAGKVSRRITLYGLFIFIIASYFSLISTSEVFLYFNF